MKRFLSLLLVLIVLASLPALAEEGLVYSTADVELHLPASWSDRVLILPTLNGAAFYQKASYDRYMEEGISYGGFLFSLGASVNNSFEELNEYIYLGFSENSYMNYYMELPSDYPPYLEDEIRAEWDAMYGALRGIAQGAVIH